MLVLSLAMAGLVQAIPPTSPSVDDSTPFEAEIARIAEPAGGRVGAAVEVLESGERAGYQADERFPMQSVYKLPIAMAVLDRVDRGALKLDQPVRIEEADLVPEVHSPIRDQHPHGGIDLTVRALVHFAIVESDGTASDVLLKLVGGPTDVTDYLRGLGVRDMVVSTSERMMTTSPRVQYRNSASPRATIALLRALHESRRVSARARELLEHDLTETGTGPKRLRGLLPPGTIVAHKTGTGRSGTSPGTTSATNDVGLVALPDGRHLAVAVFVSDSPADEAVREGVIAQIARAAWDRFARSR